MLNLLPWRDEIAADGRRQLFSIIVVATVITFLSVCCVRYWLCHRYVASLNFYKFVQEEIKYMQAIGQRSKTIIAQKKSVMDNYRSHMSQVDLMRVLDLLVKIFPDNAYLVALSLENRRLLLDGVLLSTRCDIIKNFAELIQNKFLLPTKIISLKAVSKQKIEYKMAITLPAVRL